MNQANLPAAVADWHEELIRLGPVELKLTIPADPDRLLDDPDVLRENRETDYMPYWGYLWPAARVMARQVHEAAWPVGSRVLELGCGSGLIGLAALAAGMRVTFSDYRDEALRLASYNARQNRLEDFVILPFDWLAPPEVSPFPYVIASDVFYERKFHEPLLALIPRLLQPGGEFWIGDPGRSLMMDFIRLAQTRDLLPEIYDQNGHPCGFPQPGKFQLFVFRPVT